MAILAAGIPAVASVAGTALQNRANRKEAEKARAFNAAEAQKNRNYQTRMSNTAYQRAMTDMRSAGLNPLLAYQKGGASSPAGSAASGPTARMENEVSGAVATAQAARKLKADLRISDAQARQAEAMADREESTNIILSTEKSPPQIGPDGRVIEGKTRVHGPGYWPHLERRIAADTTLKENQLPLSEAQAQFYSGIGQYAPYLAPAGAAVGVGLGAAKLMGGGGRAAARFGRKGAGVAQRTLKRLRRRRGVPGIGTGKNRIVR